MSISLDTQQLVALTGATNVEGEYLGKVRSLASLAEAGPEDLSFLGNPKYATEVPTSRAGIILVPGDYVGQPAAGQAFLRVAKPSYALALVCAAIEAQLWPKPAAGSPGAAGGHAGGGPHLDAAGCRAAGIEVGDRGSRR